MVSMPKWMWALYLAAATWAGHQSVQSSQIAKDVEAIHKVQAVIVTDFERRVTKLEERVDKLTDQLLQIDRGRGRGAIGSVDPQLSAH